MPATVPKIQQGQFSSNGSPQNQAFFNAFAAGRISNNPVIKETYWCNFLEKPGIEAFLQEYTGFDTFGFPSFTNVEYNPSYDQVKITNATATIPAYSAGTNTVVVPIDVTKSQFYGTYILPQVGETLIAPPYGAFLEVVAVNPTGSTPTMTLRHRSTTAGALVIPAGTEMPVISGKYLADCACPSGLLRVPDMPILRPLTMKTPSKGTGVICGDALLADQHLYLPFYDENGKESKVWYTPLMKKMWKDFEVDSAYMRFLDPDWGLIPTLMSRGGVFSTASSTEITVADVQAWGDAFVASGVTCRDFAIPCGRTLFVQFQNMMNAAGVDKFTFGIFDADDDCKWLNLNWCRLSIAGFNFHIFEEPWMSSSFALGAAGYNFKKAGIMIPLCDRSVNIKNEEMNGSGKPVNKMLTTTFFKDNLGRTWDKLQDGNGLYGPKNNLGPGCDSQEWTIKSRFTQTIHCPQSWGLINFV